MLAKASQDAHVEGIYDEVNVEDETVVESAAAELLNTLRGNNEMLSLNPVETNTKNIPASSEFHLTSSNWYLYCHMMNVAL